MTSTVLTIKFAAFLGAEILVVALIVGAAAAGVIRSLQERAKEASAPAPAAVEL